MKTKIYIAIAVWFMSALVLSVQGLYASAPGKPPLLVGLMMVVPSSLLVFAYLRSADLRAWGGSLDLRVLTILHLWRIGGIVFLLLYAHGKLPAGFALPAGIGDLIAGLAVLPLVTAMSKRSSTVRNWFIGWNIFGFADLIIAVGTGMLHSESSFGLLAGSGPTTRLMSQFPLSLVPTFFVPLFVLLHLLALSRSKELGSEPTQFRTAEPAG